MTVNGQRHVGVFCASSTKIPAGYMDLAEEVGCLLATHGLTLVWGGGSVGMMGRLAQGVQKQGGRVIGVIPQFMAGTEVAYTGADELIITTDMRQRKAEMEKRSDAFLVLPGGVGTLDEMFEILTLRVLEQHNKPVVIMNHQGFYDPLLAFFEHMFEAQFLRRESRNHFHIANSPAQALALLFPEQV
ncbi:MAG: TIGR00730 family Rossman fold protein [Phycisphaerales bacterium]|nr:TIGR00730 family Rossman fold protein [Phycisphaerales bacterium]